jgi:hypothetical protein
MNSIVIRELICKMDDNNNSIITPIRNLDKRMINSNTMVKSTTNDHNKIMKLKWGI